jgi:hypothetical protein
MQGEMMSDLVERLRDNEKWHTWEDLTGLIAEAAEEIERLRARDETAEAVRKLAVADALEEAAQVAEKEDTVDGYWIAENIRTLKETLE